MKRLLRATILLLVLAVSLSSFGQRYYRTVKQFGVNPQMGASPRGNLCFASDGLLYGIVDRAAPYGFHPGLFSIAPDGSNYKLVRAFDLSNNLFWPNEGLIEGSDGGLYGRATNGVFAVNKDGSSFHIVLNDFRSGGSKLLEASNGLLYGTAGDDLFQVAKTGANPKTFPLHAWVTCDLLEMPGGVLVGVADGVYPSIIRINLDGSGLQTIRAFPNVDEIASLTSGLILIGDKFYGMGRVNTADLSRQPALYSINVDGSGFRIIRQFTGPPWGPDFLTLAAGPKIVGLGPSGSGYMLFDIDSDGANFEQFPIDSGFPSSRAYPLGSLTAGPGGAFFGLARTVVPSGEDGYIYRFVAGGSSQIVRAFHAYGEDGIFPRAMIGSGDGFIYGICYQAGKFNHGTFWKIAADGSNYEILHHFGSDLNNCYAARLVEGADGQFYGIAQNDYPPFDRLSGVVFRISRTGDALSILQSHLNEFPEALVSGADGRLYVGVSCGSTNKEDRARIYSMKGDGSDVKVVRAFTYAEASRISDVIQGSDGNLYASIAQQSTLTSVTLKITLAGAAQILRSWPQYPYYGNGLGRLTEARDGSLLGMMSLWGAFKINKDGSGFVSLGVTNYETVEPLPLFEDADGTLLGIAPSTFFRVDKTGANFKALRGGWLYAQSGVIRAPDGTPFGTSGNDLFRLGPAPIAPNLSMRLEYSDYIPGSLGPSTIPHLRIAGAFGTRVIFESTKTLNPPTWAPLELIDFIDPSYYLLPAGLENPFFRARFEEF